MTGRVKIALLLLLFVGQTMAGVCPPPGEISPCSCSDLGSDGLVIQLSCSSKSLVDSRASEILNTMLSWPGVSPLRSVNFYNNYLTRIPSELSLFPLLNTIRLDNNAISSISTNAFNFSTATLTSLNLDSNQITAIQDGAFQGNYGNSIVTLQYNSLTRFEAGVFQYILAKMEPYYDTQNAYVDIFNSRIDCTTDRCHMAWLILYNRQLIKVIKNGYCSSGTSFSNLDSSLYSNCPFVCPALSDGFYTDPQSCTNYYNCIRGTPSLQTCPFVNGEQLIFDPLTRQCDKAVNTPGCSVKPFFCPSANGYYANPNSCHTYYRCINDVAYLLDCGQLVYDPTSQRCDIIPCTITTTSTEYATTDSTHSSWFF